MLGMIKKDLFMVKNNLKTLIMALVIYVFYSLMFDMDMSWFFPFMIVMISISTFHYDDFNNWHSYATTLPQGRINIVKSKYLTTIILILIATMVSISFSFIIGNIDNIENSLLTIFGELFAICFLMSILFPFLFKYGAEKGRIALMIIGFSILGVTVLLSKYIKIDIPNSLISFLDSHFIVIFIVATILMIGISYLISKKIYLKREF